ncbi:hypothetical protein HAX54_042727, partial [Datura stramonium]|nr:hypothetical protein [Datura stramonium]
MVGIFSLRGHVASRTADTSNVSRVRDETWANKEMRREAYWGVKARLSGCFGGRQRCKFGARPPPARGGARGSRVVPASARVFPVRAESVVMARHRNIYAFAVGRRRGFRSVTT